MTAIKTKLRATILTGAIAFLPSLAAADTSQPSNADPTEGVPDHAQAEARGTPTDHDDLERARPRRKQRRAARQDERNGEPDRKASRTTPRQRHEAPAGSSSARLGGRSNFLELPRP